ncbi:MAG: hypothetical protein ACFCVE_08500 [Phycisphaerae bacterium]
MESTDAFAAQLRRYRLLLRSVVNRADAFEAREMPDTQVQADRGLALVRQLNGEPDAAALLLSPPPADAPRTAAADAAGHRRPAYLPLVLACWLEAAPDDGRLPGWLEHVWQTRAEGVLAPAGTPAAVGEQAVAQVWDALVLGVAADRLGRDDYRVHAADVFARLVSGQTDAGPFLTFDGRDNPEPWWAQELTILQALTSYAVRTNDDKAYDAAMRNAEYHLYETQPDHATAQPWGINGFVLSDSARPMADQLMLSMDVNNFGRARGVSLLVIAQALVDVERRHPGLATAEVSPGRPGAVKPLP